MKLQPQAGKDSKYSDYINANHVDVSAAAVQVPVLTLSSLNPCLLVSPSGLQQTARLHRGPGTTQEHLQGLLEDGVGAEHQRHRHDHQPSGEGTGEGHGDGFQDGSPFIAALISHIWL